jgi:hypothetical protein
MPVRDTLERPGVLGEEVLRAELRAELEHPKASGEPEIVIERPNPATVHLYVIWSKWNDLEQMARSRIILDAYTETKGESEANKVTVAMGLTPAEASRLGVK